MPGRVGLRSLSQFHELTSKDIVQAQLLRDLTRDIKTMRAARIDVDLLEKQNIRVQISQEIHNRGQLQASVDVPIQDAKGAARPGKPPEGGEILGNDFIFWHKSKCPSSKLGKYALLGETQVQWIINFSP